MVRRFVQAPSKICFPFPNAFYRLFTRRIREKYPKVFRNVPSGVPGQIFRGKEMHLFLHYCKTRLLIQFFYLFVLSPIILFCSFVCFLPTYSASLEDILLKIWRLFHEECKNCAFCTISLCPCSCQRIGASRGVRWRTTWSAAYMSKLRFSTKSQTGSCMSLFSQMAWSEAPSGLTLFG